MRGSCRRHWSFTRGKHGTQSHTCAHPSLLSLSPPSLCVSLSLPFRLMRFLGCCCCFASGSKNMCCVAYQSRRYNDNSNRQRERENVGV